MNLGNRFSQHSFAQVPEIYINRSKFDRSFAVKDTVDFDYLNPCFWDLMYPGDTVKMNVSHFMRLATPKVPVMDNLWVDFYFFSVPLRLLWTNFEKFMGAQDNPGDSISYTIPQLAALSTATAAVGTIYDKFGLPPINYNTTNTPVMSLPFRAYNKIWNTWFRDQNLQNSVTELNGDSSDPVATYALLKANKKHDYFTSSLPWAQKGTAVSLPLGTSAPVYGQLITGSGATRNAFQMYNSTDSAVEYGGINKTAGTMGLEAGGGWTGLVAGDTANSLSLATAAQYTSLGASYTPPYADLTNATAATINALRLAIQTQAFLERDARGGTRYTELVLSHFNVFTGDARVQRPEYLGGGTSRINCHPVAQTAPTSGSNAQGQLAAFGTSAGTVGFSKTFQEHCLVIGMFKARADITYQQGVKREWSYQTRYDLFWPEFEGLGEQTTYNREIWADGSANDAAVFGYQERYAECKYYPSLIKGQFRSDYSTPLDQWHMAEDFATLPTLSSTFIQSTTPISRATALSSTGATLLCDMWFDYKHARPMKMYGVPASLMRM